MTRYTDYATAMEALEAGLPPHPDDGYFGSRLHPDAAQLILIPVPWEATASYGKGTSGAPEAILRASHQLDLEDGAFGTPYRAGIAAFPPCTEIATLNRDMAEPARQVIDALEQGETAPAALARVNRAAERVNQRVGEAADTVLEQGKIAAVVGGDHSSPYGLIEALAARHPEGFSILHIDAHHDLREAYEGFHWSHASIFHNVMERLPDVTRLVQVGVRDYARDEARYRRALGERCRCHYDDELFRRKAAGVSWQQLVLEIIAELTERVYISLDIDGLDPGCCPTTGTPVPGGLSFSECAYLLEALAASGRKVIGFDLCEVTPGASEWDASVGARVLYKLCGCSLRSHGRC